MNKVNSSQRLNPSSFTPDKGPLRCAGERKIEERESGSSSLPPASRQCMHYSINSLLPPQPAFHKEGPITTGQSLSHPLWNVLPLCLSLSVVVAAVVAE